MKDSAHEIFDHYLASLLAGRHLAPTSGTLPSGIHFRVLGHGIVVFEPFGPAQPIDVLISAGVHGNETAPIELADAIIRDLAAGNIALGARVQFVFGNVEAMRAGTRYVADDLNRLLRPQESEAGSLRAQPRPDSAEGKRAAELEQAARAFFGEESPGQRTRLHFDLHTAIRGSEFERFALCPFRADGRYSRAALGWLAQHGIGAVLLNEAPAGTFSYFTSAEFGADSFTLELGKALRFGKNDLTRFAGIDAGLRSLLRGELWRASGEAMPKIFRVVQVLIKRSDHFQLHVPNDVLNFAAYPRGTVICEDGEERYVVTHEAERIVFPNRKVKNGLRAGLMVVSIEDQN